MGVTPTGSLERRELKEVEHEEEEGSPSLVGSLRSDTMKMREVVKRSGDIILSGKNIATDTVIGTKIGTAANQKLGFFGATPVVQRGGVAVSAAGIHAALVQLGLITA